MNYYVQDGISAKRKFISIRQYEDLTALDAVDAGQFDPAVGEVAIEIEVDTGQDVVETIYGWGCGDGISHEAKWYDFTEVRVCGFCFNAGGAHMRGPIDVPAVTFSIPSGGGQEDHNGRTPVDVVLGAIRQKIGAARFDGTELEQ